MLPQQFSVQGWETTPSLWHLILRPQHLELQRMMTVCVQSEQDENDDQDVSQEPPQKEMNCRWEGCTVHMQRNYSRTRCADAGLGWGWVHESARGWDIDCGNGVVLGNLFKNSVGWDGVGDKLCGNGWGWGEFGNPMQASSMHCTCLNNGTTRTVHKCLERNNGHLITLQIWMEWRYLVWGATHKAILKASSEAQNSFWIKNRTREDMGQFSAGPINKPLHFSQVVWQELMWTVTEESIYLE